MRTIAKIAALGVIVASLAAVPAWAAPPEGLQISTPGDTDMSCEQIAGEIGAMDTLISHAYETEDATNKASVGFGVIKTVGSYLVGTLTGTIGFMAVGHLAAEAADSRGDDANAVGDIALQRRSLLVGIHQTKKCPEALPEPPPPPEEFWPSLRSAAAAEELEPAAGEVEESGTSAGDNMSERAAMPHEMRTYND